MQQTRFTHSSRKLISVNLIYSNNSSIGIELMEKHFLINFLIILGELIYFFHYTYPLYCSYCHFSKYLIQKLET
jgi:hypothetical protein